MTIDPSQQAAALYANTHNCAQTILEVSGGGQESPVKQALFDSAAGLGGGLASQGLVCGAMIGGLMALNLRLKERGIADPERSAAMKALVVEFKRRNLHTDCADLTGMKFEGETLERCRARVVEVVQYVEQVMARLDQDGLPGPETK